MDANCEVGFSSNVAAIKDCLNEVELANSPICKEFAEKIKPIVVSSLMSLKKTYDSACKALLSESRYDVEVKRCEDNSKLALGYLRNAFSEIEVIDREVQRIACDISKQKTSNPSLTGNLNRYRKLQNTDVQAADAMLNKQNSSPSEKTQMNVLKGHLLKLEQLKSLKEKSHQLAEKVEKEFQAIVDKKGKECPKSWVKLGYDGLPLKREPIADTGGFARDYSKEVSYSKMGYAHMSGRLKIFELTAKACEAESDELRWHNRSIGGQCLAHSQIRCAPAKMSTGYENAHISLLPQIGLKKKDGSNIRFGEWCELNSNVSMSVLNPKCDTVYPLSYILNCTDYMPKEFNQIDDYCETELRSYAVDLLNEVVSKKAKPDTAAKKLSVGFQKTLTNLKFDLAGAEEPSRTKGSRISELFHTYKNASRKPHIDDAILSMQTAAKDYASSK